MTLAQARSVLRTLLNSDPAAARQALEVDVVALDTILDGVNKALWLRAVKQAQSLYTQFQDVTVPADGGGLPQFAGMFQLWMLDGSLSNPPTLPGLHRVVKVELFTQAGSLITLEAIGLTDRTVYDAQVAGGAVCREPVAWYTAFNDASITVFSSPPVVTYSETIVFVPKPTRDIKIRLHYVRNLPDWTDNDEALGGMPALAGAHMLIPVQAAILLGATRLGPLEAQFEKVFNDTLVKRHGGPRRSHYVPYE